MFKIFPYKVGSASVKKLKEATGGTIIKLKNSKYRYKPRDVVINWGNSSRPPNLEGVVMINQPESVAIAANKVLTFETLSKNNVPTVPFTTNVDIARDWQLDGHKIYVRHKLTGHSGDGIEVIDGIFRHDIDELERIASSLVKMGHDTAAGAVIERILELEERLSMEDLPPAPLYTMGVKNYGEYRVHVMGEDVILYQKKSRKVDDETGEVMYADGIDDDVRNLASGWIYRTGNLKRLERIETLAIAAIKALGLDFGAVDIIKDESGDVMVLEVNSAPGLGNVDSLTAYVKGFRNLIAE